MPILHILLTGKPRTGKTTLLKRIVKELPSCGGFYTEEITEGGPRVGFKIITLDGKEGILAKKGLKSRYTLGSYGINLDDLDTIGVKAIEQALETKEIIVIDEIGKMELFSNQFKASVVKALDSGKRVIGTIHMAQIDFLNTLRERKDVVLFNVNLDNHEEIFYKVLCLIKREA